MHDWVNVATILRVKSSDGFVLRCKTGLSAYIRPGLSCALVPPQIDCPRFVHISRVAPGKKDEISVSFDVGLNDTQRYALVGMALLARRNAFPAIALAACEAQDYAGWQVFSGSNEELLGTVSYLQQNSAQPLLVVARSAGDEVLIPFVEAFVQTIAYEERAIYVDVPQGLLELNTRQ